MPAGGAVPAEALATLRRRLAALPARHPERTALIRFTAELYAIGRATLYRLLRGERRPRDARRADRGRSRLMLASEIERWCEIVAAMKVRTTNRKGRHLSTVRILDLLTRHGVDTPDGFEKLQPGRLIASTLNCGDHRTKPHSRVDDWMAHQPADGIREMCAWERFCAFAREPERRAVALDCRMTIAGITYEVDPEFAGETVVMWWGLFDQELWVEFRDQRSGPFLPVGGPIPLHRYRKHRKSRREANANRITHPASAQMRRRA